MGWDVVVLGVGGDHVDLVDWLVFDFLFLVDLFGVFEVDDLVDGLRSPS